MRILASNPDTLGDFVLRQPLYRAVIDAGHELTLAVRAGVLPLARYVAPGAKTLVLPGEVYGHDTGKRWDEFAAFFTAAKAFAPEVLLVAPYRWTLLEEKLSEVLPPEVRKVGMSGHLYAGDPYAGAAPPSRLRLDAVAEVREEQLEVEKNAALCAAVLGRPPDSIDPRLHADPAVLESAGRAVEQLGLEPGGFWVACVGGTAHVAIKAWQPEKWAHVLGGWAKRYGRRFLFVGLAEEEPSARQVIRGMHQVLGSDDAVARHAAVRMGHGTSLDELLALTQLSAGYVGHDTGPMHVAAAMGKQVLAVFGGGTWPRFRPAVQPSVALLVGVPCVGCGWVCAFEQPYCIRAVPVEEVLPAVADLEEGRIKERVARVLEPGEALQRRMILEGARHTQQQVREKAELALSLQDAHRRRREEAAALNEARAAEARQYAEAEAARAAEAQELRAVMRAAHEETRLVAEAAAQREAAVKVIDGALQARTAELEHLRGEIRGVVRFVEQTNGNGVHAADVARGDVDDVDRLRDAVSRLERRMRELESGAVRRPWRQVLTDFVIGGKTYRRRIARPPMPTVSVVMPVTGCESERDVRATAESVLGQRFAGLAFIIVDGSSPGETAALLDGYNERCDRLLREPGISPGDAVALGLSRASGEVLHVLHPGDVLEPDGVLRVAEYFARHRGVQAVYFEDALHFADSGWKFPAPPQPTANVYRLMRQDEPFRNGVFFRRRAYEALGPVKPEFGEATEWEWWLRLARRYGLRRLDGQVRSIRADRAGGDDAYHRDAVRAREAFEATFGLAGRVRCRAIDAADRVFDALRQWFPGQVLFFPAGRGEQSGRLPSGEGPALVARQPVSSLLERSPDRILFSTPDTTGGDRGAPRRTMHHVYYDSDSGAALAYPPMDLERLSAMYAARHAEPNAAVVRPDVAVASPYARYRGGVLGWLGVGDLLARLPSPYSWFRPPVFDDNEIICDEVLGLLRGLVSSDDTSVRFLNVGCFDGAILDRVKAATRWQTFGAEANGAAAAAARAKGHAVWEAAPQDLPLELPVGEPFRVVFLANTVEHLQDPLRVLRRLRQLLEPGGLLVLNQPNLDSAHATLFGPTWGRWEVPYHRTLTGQRGLRRMATLADMKVLRLRTRTHPYPTCVSVQLNDLGLAAIVPDTARFPDDVAARGVRLAGWSRLLWDWRGRGDFMYALLRAL